MSTVKLILHSPNGAALDLTQYVAAEVGAGMEPGDPHFTNKVFAHSLLKPGGSLALEDLQLKEMVFPLKLKPAQAGVEGVNLVYNGSFEYGTGAWSAESPTTIVRSTAQAKIGNASLRIKTSHAGSNAITSLAPTIFLANQPYTVSFFIKGAAGAEKLSIWLTAGSTESEPGGPVAITTSWVEHSFTWTPEKNQSDVSLYVEPTTATAYTVYLDGIMVVPSASAAEYNDGDSPGWHWIGAPGESVSRTQGSGKVGLLDLVEELNTLLNTPGVQVEWRDEGASRSTFFDLASGQFDDEYNFYMGIQDWLKGKLRLFVQPLGHYSQAGARALELFGKPTSVAVGTSPIIPFRAAGRIEGDAAALVQAQVHSSLISFPQTYAALSILSGPSYVPWVPVASAFMASPLAAAGYSFQSNAAGGTAAKWVNPATGTYLTFRASGARESYAEPQRMLLFARNAGSNASQAILAEAANGAGTPLTTIPVTVPGETGWDVYDLGVISTATTRVGYGSPYEWTVKLAHVGASCAVEVAGVAQLPEARTTWLNGDLVPSTVTTQRSLAWDGVANTLTSGVYLGVGASGSVPSSAAGAAEITGYGRGGIPAMPPILREVPYLAVLAVDKNNQNRQTEVNINVLERCRYAFG